MEHCRRCGFKRGLVACAKCGKLGPGMPAIFSAPLVAILLMYGRGWLLPFPWGKGVVQGLASVLFLVAVIMLPISLLLVIGIGDEKSTEILDPMDRLDLERLMTSDIPSRWLDRYSICFRAVLTVGVMMAMLSLVRTFNTPTSLTRLYLFGVAAGISCWVWWISANVNRIIFSSEANRQLLFHPQRLPPNFGGLSLRDIGAYAGFYSALRWPALIGMPAIYLAQTAGFKALQRPISTWWESVVMVLVMYTLSSCFIGAFVGVLATALVRPPYLTRIGWHLAAVCCMAATLYVLVVRIPEVFSRT